MTPRELSELIKRHNSGHRGVTIRFRGTTAHNLYLDLVKDRKRKVRSLSLSIPLCATKSDAQEVLQQAVHLRDAVELDLKGGLPGQPADLYAEIERLIEQKEKPQTRRNHKVALRYIREFFGEHPIDPRSITPREVGEYRRWLLELPIHRNHARTQFKRLKTFLNLLVRDEVITRSPAVAFSISEQEPVVEYLTIDQVRALKATPCHRPELKAAFLFSVYSGLRISDIMKLTFRVRSSGMIQLMQTKTEENNLVPLHSECVRILDEMAEESGSDYRETALVFQLPTSSKRTKYMRRWFADASVTGVKPQFKLARATFVVLMVNASVPLAVASALAGHRSTATTERYYSAIMDQTRISAIQAIQS